MRKVGIVGAGQVGATLAQRVAESALADVALVDVAEGVARGKALDIAQSLAFHSSPSRVEGGGDHALLEGSSVVVVTAGFPRKPGMTREDLIARNAEVVGEVVKNAVQAAPGAVLVMVTNPLDSMSWLAWRVSGLDRHRVVGMAGTLDCARFQYFVGQTLGVPPSEVRCMILGSHGDSMVILPGYAQVGGIPLQNLLPGEEIERLAARTRDGGAEIVSMLQSGSAFYAPSAAVYRLLRAILNDEGSVLPASVLLEGEMGFSGIFMGVPVVVGEGGWKKVVELELGQEEREALERSAAHIRRQLEELRKMLRL